MYPYSTYVRDRLRPEAPKKVKVKQKTAASATVSWKAVKGAKKYEVFMRTNDPQGKLKKVATVTGKSTVVSKLKAGNTYYFVVRAVAGKATGDDSEPVTFRLK